MVEIDPFDEEATVAFSIRLSVAMHKKVRYAAYRMGISMNQVIANILKVQLKNVDPDSKPFNLEEEHEVGGLEIGD